MAQVREEPGLGRSDVDAGRRGGHPSGRLLPQAPLAQEQGDRRGAARSPSPDPEDDRRVVDRDRRGSWPRPASFRRRGFQGQRTQRSTAPSASSLCSRPATAGTSAASPRRTIPTPGSWTVFVYDGYPGGAGISERGFRVAGGLAGRHPRVDRSLRVRRRLPVVHPVAEVRQPEPPARQARRPRPARRAAGVALLASRPRRMRQRDLVEPARPQLRVLGREPGAALIRCRTPPAMRRRGRPMPARARPRARDAHHQLLCVERRGRWRPIQIKPPRARRWSERQEVRRPDGPDVRQHSVAGDRVGEGDQRVEPTRYGDPLVRAARRPHEQRPW